MTLDDRDEPCVVPYIQRQQRQLQNDPQEGLLPFFEAHPGLPRIFARVIKEADQLIIIFSLKS